MDIDTRLARLTDVGAIQAIELKAASLFPEIDLPEHLRGEVLSEEHLMRSIECENLWVATDLRDVPIGFVLPSTVGQRLHLEEVSVLPAHARKGIGRVLVETVLNDAKQRNCVGVSLTTFSHLPWNGPFYESCGFVELGEDEMDDHLSSRLRQEKQLGLRNRIAMAAYL